MQKDSVQNPAVQNPVKIVVTVPDPDDDTRFTLHAERHNILEWRTESSEYPAFEVRFTGKNPVDEEEVFVGKGSTEKPLTMFLENHGQYQYQVNHHKHDGSVKYGHNRDAHIHNCQGCPP